MDLLSVSFFFDGARRFAFRSAGCSGAAPLFLAINLVSALSPKLIQALLWASALLALLAVLQWLHIDPFISLLGWQPQTFSNPRMRVYGTLGNPNFVAAWLCAALPLVFDFFCIQFNKLSGFAWTRAMFMLLQLLAILATGSRVPLIAVAVLLVVWGSFRMKRELRWIVMVLLPLAVLLLWISPARPLGKTLAGRWFIADIILSRSGEIPVFGFGPGSFPSKYAEWQTSRLKALPKGDPALIFSGPLDHAHNDYLEFLVEYGYAGLLAFGVMVCIFLWKFISRQFRSSPKSIILLIQISSLCILLTIALVDFPFHRPAEWGLFWIMMGLELAEQS